MELFLIRHAHALDGADDAARPLSAKGRSQVKRLAEFLRDADVFTPQEIWHSPLVRAMETAALLARHAGVEVPSREVAGLLPGDEPSAIVKQFARAPGRLALVGHEPQLSALASLLVAGAASPPVFELKKCGVLALEGAGRWWRARWQISPAVLGEKKR